METISFFVPGIPIAKGSAKAFYNKATGRAMITQTNREKQQPWASTIAYYAQEAGCKPSSSPIAIILLFTMPRPKSHFGTGKNSSILKANAPDYHTSKPDLDKLIRCVKDALTGVAWMDDSQVCLMRTVSKRYGSNPGVKIMIEQAIRWNNSPDTFQVARDCGVGL